MRLRALQHRIAAASRFVSHRTGRFRSNCFRCPSACVNIHPLQACFQISKPHRRMHVPISCCTSSSPFAASTSAIHRKPSHTRRSSRCCTGPFGASPGNSQGYRRKTSHNRRSVFCCNICAPQELQARQSHFAFAISRAVKRQVFEWASRESGKMGVTDHYDGEAAYFADI